jgi:hypothetical protein
MVQTKGFKTTRDGGLIVHPDVAMDNSIKVPQTDSTYSSGFGDSITDVDRAFAACREPIGHFLTHIVADDMVDKWFTVDDPDTEEADPALDRSCQQHFNRLQFKKHLRKAVESARIYGRSLLVGAFNDAKTVEAFATPVREGAELMQLSVYPDTFQQQKVKEFQIESLDIDPTSRRYGQPVIYKLYRVSMNETGQTVSSWVRIHFSRVCEVGDGTSVLDKVWDDVGCGRNIRWGTAQYMFRVGGGFPVFAFPAGTSAAQLEAYGASGAFNNLMSRTYILIAQNSTQENTGMTFEFKGAASAAIDPTPFYTQNLQQIAIATGYPQAKLIGAQAGAVTGSEVNQQEYYKAISRDQEFYCEEPIRWVLEHLAKSGQITIIKSATDEESKKIKHLKNMLRRFIKHDYRHKTVNDYLINWNSAFELSDKDNVQIEETHARANQIRLDYMSIDEVRAEEGLLPLPDGAGEWKDAPEGLQLFNQKGAPNDPKNPEDPNVKEDPLKEQLRDSDMFITFAPKPKYPIRRKTLSQDAGEAEGSWVTINGVHILIKEGETAASAFERATGKKLEGSSGGETKTINTPSNQVGSGEKMFSPEITNVISAWKSEGANPPTEIGNGVETLSFEQFSRKYPDAKITRVGKFGLEAEVSGTDRHGAKFTDLYSAYASRKR